MKRIIAWILSAVLCILPLAGCQSGGGNETEEPVVQENTESGVQQDEEAGTPENQPEVVTATRQEKARTVITTDGEVDDRDSVLRALLYALTFPELYPHCHKSAIIESISDCSIPHEERMSICRLISL